MTCSPAARGFPTRSEGMMPGSVSPGYALYPYCSGLVLLWDRPTDREPRIFILFIGMDLGWPGRGLI